MPKDPATLWYWNDWAGGTVTLTRHLKGCYIDLLHAQFNSGHLSIEQIKVILNGDFETAWPILRTKFIQDADGLLYNERADVEKARRQAYCESRRKNKKQTYDDTYVHHMTPHMENENRNEDVNEKGKGGIGGKTKIPYEEKPELDWNFEKGKFLTDTLWQQKVLELNKTLTEWLLKDYIKEFIVHIETSEDFKTCRELKKHFGNWFRKKAEIKAVGQSNGPALVYTPPRRDNGSGLTEIASVLKKTVPPINWGAEIEADRKKVKADPAYVPKLQAKKFEYMLKSGATIPPDVKARLMEDARFQRVQELRSTFEEITSRSLLHEYDAGRIPGGDKLIIDRISRELAYQWLIEQQT